jgi:tetratricopeptide repeat protein
LRPLWRAIAFLLATTLPSVLIGVRSIRVTIASTLGESTDLVDLRTALRLDPENPELHYKLGLVYSRSPDELNPAEGLKHLRRATELNPNRSSYWAGLASVCESMGNAFCADQSFQRALTLSPMKPHLYWATANYYLWTGRTQRALARFRQLLTMSPEYALPTFDICLRILDDPRPVVQEVLPAGNDPGLKLAYANFLTTRGKADFASQVWNQTLASAPPFPFSLAEPYLENLIARGSYQEALSAWQDLKRLGIVAEAAIKDRDNLVFNGGFERYPLNSGFDWRYREPLYASIDFPNFGAYEGDRCLSLNFTVGRNEEDELLYQIVPVVPSQEYVLIAYVRSENITSDSGPRLRALDLDCPNCLNLSSETIVGTTPWHPINLRFTTGTETHFVRLSIWRPRSRSFPSEITGHFWMDSVSLKAEKQLSPVLAGKE